jgi:hypothetical protein
LDKLLCVPCWPVKILSQRKSPNELQCRNVRTKRTKSPGVFSAPSLGLRFVCSAVYVPRFNRVSAQGWSPVCHRKGFGAAGPRQTVNPLLTSQCGKSARWVLWEPEAVTRLRPPGGASRYGSLPRSFIFRFIPRDGNSVALRCRRGRRAQSPTAGPILGTHAKVTLGVDPRITDCFRIGVVLLGRRE